MIKYLELLRSQFGFNSVMAIFNNDAHRIVSKRGQAILRDKDSKEVLLENDPLFKS